MEKVCTLLPEDCPTLCIMKEEVDWMGELEKNKEELGMNMCKGRKVGETKQKKGEEDKVKNTVEDKRGKDMEKTKKKEDDNMAMNLKKINKDKEKHSECEVKRKRGKGKHAESKTKKVGDKKQQKYGNEKKEKVKRKKDEDNQEYVPKYVEKLTASKEDVNVNDNFPEFCILIPSEEVNETLRIPLASDPVLESESLGAVSLKGPSGNIWRAKLVLDSDGLCLVNGWKGFFMDHHVESGDLLLFRYDGHSQFSVSVFDGNTECLKKSAFHACPGNALVVESEDAVLGIDANDTSPHYVGANEGNNAIDSLQCDELALCIGGIKTPKITENEKSINEAHASQHDIQETGSLKFSGSSRKVDKLSRDTFGASMEAAIMGTDSDDTSEHCRRVNVTVHLQSNEKTMDCAKHTAQKGTIDEADPTSCLPGLMERKRELADIISSLQSRKRRSSRLNSMKAVVKIPEPKVFISQRLVITEKDKENAPESATRLNLNHPFFVQIMKDIPREFMRKYLPKVTAKMTLWDRQGRPWEVNYVYHKSLGTFCRGWGAFVSANNIEKGDICLFELFQENNFKVGVFGAAQEKIACIPMLE